MKTLLHEAFDIESEYYPVPPECYNTLEDILSKADMIDIKDSPVQVLADIGRLLHQEGFKFQENALISRGLQNNVLNCVSSSFFYFSIGERLGLPLHLVCIPQHLFIRWEDGICRVSWETCEPYETMTGEIDESSYVSTYNIHKESISRGSYLRNLTRAEALAVVFNSIGIQKKEDGDFEGALAIYSKSILLNSDFPFTFHNRGNSKYGIGDLDGAIADYNEAISLDPNFKWSYGGRGYIKKLKGDLEGAELDFRMYEKLNPIQPRL